MSVMSSPKDAQSSKNAENLAKVIQPGKTCAVCLIYFKPTDVVKMLECTHEFHEECIGKWLATRGNCPFCRHVVDASVAENLAIIDEAVSSNGSSPILPLVMDDLNITEDGFLYLTDPNPDSMFEPIDEDEDLTEPLELPPTPLPFEYFNDYGSGSEDSSG